MMKKLVAVLLVAVSYSVIAQNIPGNDSTVPAVKSDSIQFSFPSQKNIIDTQLSNSLHPGRKKFKIDRVHLIFSINYSYLNPFAVEKDVFKGPYYPVADSTPVWTER